MSAIQSAIDKMQANRAMYKEKGTYGEQAVVAVIQEYKNIRGGVLIHSFSYNYASNRQGVNYPGNIKRESDGKYKSYDGKEYTKDEIDVLYITPYRIFAIESKARGGTWKIDDVWCTQNSTPVDKSPLAQAEKHCRHLYHRIYEYLPDGNPNYIVPMVVFVDKARVLDSRSSDMKFYLPVTIVNMIKMKIKENDTPLQYELDIKSISKALNRLGSGQTIL